jgi:prepilin-type N-terminal cleavage/methylation domain-containing protein
MKKKDKNYIFYKGFTLTEMLVSISVIVLISTLILFSYHRLREDFSLRRAAQNIVFSFRDVQTSAIAVKKFQPTGTFPGYGIHFDMVNNNKYIIFADVNNNKIYDPGNGCYDAPTECDEEFILEKPIKIKDLCGNEKSDPSNAQCALSSLDIVFLRPDPKIFLTANLGSQSFNDVKITISSPFSKKSKNIIVWKIGQVYME